MMLPATRFWIARVFVLFWCAWLIENKLSFREANRIKWFALARIQRQMISVLGWLRWLFNFLLDIQRICTLRTANTNGHNRICEHIPLLSSLTRRLSIIHFGKNVTILFQMPGGPYRFEALQRDKWKWKNTENAYCCIQWLSNSLAYI